jgi:hypothetical protein
MLSQMVHRHRDASMVEGMSHSHGFIQLLPGHKPGGQAAPHRMFCEESVDPGSLRNTEYSPAEEG